jgi:hypothetical protein
VRLESKACRTRYFWYKAMELVEVFFSRKRQCEKGLLELVNFARVNGGLKGKVSKGKLEKGELHKAKASKDVSQRTI